MTSTNPTIAVPPARAALLELHRRLLQVQRIEVERLTGKLSVGALLQIATDDPRFAWLKPLLALVAELDQARSEDDADAAQAVLARARVMLEAPDPDTPFGARYLQLLQEQPDVVFAHRDAKAALTG
jgi:hypothetical protein